MGGIKYINPFNKATEYSFLFISESGDLIFPEAYDDLSFIDEGPYEIPYVSVDSGDVVFDLGSNAGLFAASVAGKCKKVYAFEPVKAVNKYVSAEAEIYPNIELCEYAVGDYSGKADFYVNEDALTIGKIVENDFYDSENNKNKVDIITIDDFVEKNNIEKVDYIKADIEGAERNMLKGAVRTLKKFAPKISICEYHLKDDPEVLEKLILEANPNYVVKHKYKKIYAYVPKKNG